MNRTIKSNNITKWKRGGSAGSSISELSKAAGEERGSTPSSFGISSSSQDWIKPLQITLQAERKHKRDWEKKKNPVHSFATGNKLTLAIDSLNN